MKFKQSKWVIVCWLGIPVLGMILFACEQFADNVQRTPILLFRWHLFSFVLWNVIGHPFWFKRARSVQWLFLEAGATGRVPVCTVIHNDWLKHRIVALTQHSSTEAGRLLFQGEHYGKFCQRVTFCWSWMLVPNASQHVWMEDQK